jgi:NitT/TauT family transport system ATP-binding protein
MLGLLVLLQDHHGEEDLARLADDLDLEIDEILPSSDWAEALQLVKVHDGRMNFTSAGTRIVAATIRERKAILREQLKKTRLFATLARALENAPGARLTGEEVNRLIAFTTAPADDLVLNIINWGRYTELFRYDQEEEVLTLIPHRPPRAPTSAGRDPPAGPAVSTGATSKAPGRAPSSGDTVLHTAQGMA